MPGREIEKQRDSEALNALLGDTDKSAGAANVLYSCMIQKLKEHFFR
jgi:hypothetical protein